MKEKDRVEIDPRLGRLMRDRFDEVAEVRWRKVLPPMEETRETLEAIFRRYVKHAYPIDPWWEP